MKQLIRKILLVVTVFLLAAALPSVVRESIETGHLYLFSDQLGADVVARFNGPGRFRFLIQPAIAIILGILGGKRDSAQGRPAYLYGILSGKLDRKEAVKEGFETISIMLIIGVLADIVFQFVLFRIVHIIPALILGPILITLPYAVARGLSNRLFSTRSPEPF